MLHAIVTKPWTMNKNETINYDCGATILSSKNVNVRQNMNIYSKTLTDKLRVSKFVSFSYAIYFLC